GKHSGIYLDNGCRNFIVHHNLSYNNPKALVLNSPSNYNLIYNNTLVATETGVYTGWFGGPDWRNTQIKNNIIPKDLSDDGAIMSNNILVGTDPQFVDPATNNYQLKSTSPAINKGAVLSPYTDGYAGTAPDIGAFEFGLSAWKVGATAATGEAGATNGSAAGSINLPASGTYRVWSRIMAPDTSNNSFSLKIDGGAALNVGDSAIPANTWTWVDYQNGSNLSNIY